MCLMFAHRVSGGCWCCLSKIINIVCHNVQLVGCFDAMVYMKKRTNATILSLDIYKQEL